MTSAAGLTDQEVHQRLLAAARAADAAQLELAQWAAEWDRRQVWQADGSRNATAALSARTGRSLPSARRVLVQAHALANLPRTIVAVRAERLSIEHLDLLAGAATPERARLFARDEQMLVDQIAATTVFDDARRIVRYWCHRADDQLGSGAPGEHPGRVYLSRHQVTGRGILEGELDAVGAEIVDRELRRLAEQIRLRDRQQGIGRTAAQRRALALVQMAARSAGADGPSTRPLFEVVVGEDSMRHLCELASGIVLTPDQLIDWTDLAVFESFLFGDRTTIISVSRQRTFRGALRRAIRVRDRRCQHLSGCHVSGDRCDVDHLQPVSQGGATSQSNGALGCWPHNRTIQRGSKPAPSAERRLTRDDEARARQRWRLRRIRADFFEDDQAA